MESASLAPDQLVLQQEAVEVLLGKFDRRLQHIVLAYYRYEWTVEQLSDFHQLSVYQVRRKLAKARDALAPALVRMNAYRFRS